jgi:hypothetical protein
LRLDAKPANLGEWENTVAAIEHPKHDVTIAIIGKYVEHKDAYKSLGEALRHGGLKQSTRVNLRWMESEDIEARGAEVLKDVDGILVPGGFGKRGFEGKIAAARYAREHKIPYFRHLLRHARRGRRFRAQYRRSGRRELERERTSLQGSGHRADHRMDDRCRRRRAP